MTRILVVEDDATVRDLLVSTLHLYGYDFLEAANGRDALQLSQQEQPDVCILDLCLPDISGVEVIRSVRKDAMYPIIVVSALADVTDKILALDAGADDYLTKPFSVDELLARIRVALRKASFDRSQEKTGGQFRNGDLLIDYDSTCVTVAGEEIHLTPIEFRLLSLLARNAGKVLTHNYILREIWGVEEDSDTRSLRVFMATLRKKIERPDSERMLQTHVGIGYRLLRLHDDAENELK